jgi:holliday junction DNA helicase RuvA
MIGYLRGVLLERTVKPEKGDVIIDVNGVGYKVAVPLGAVGRLGGVGDTVAVYVHTNVREDAIELFAFPTRDERVCFEILIGAHGVGPSLALKILSVLSPTALRTAVATDDLAALTAVKGVGKKTAAQVLLDLKSKLDVDGNDDPSGVIGALRSDDPTGPVDGGPRNDVRVALGELGYGADEVKNVLRQLSDSADSAVLLREALALLVRS